MDVSITGSVPEDKQVLVNIAKWCVVTGPQWWHGQRGNLHFDIAGTAFTPHIAFDLTPVKAGIVAVGVLLALFFSGTSVGMIAEAQALPPPPAWTPTPVEHSLSPALPLPEASDTLPEPPATKTRSAATAAPSSQPSTQNTAIPTKTKPSIQKSRSTVSPPKPLPPAPVPTVSPVILPKSAPPGQIKPEPPGQVPPGQIKPESKPVPPGQIQVPPGQEKNPEKPVPPEPPGQGREPPGQVKLPEGQGKPSK